MKAKAGTFEADQATKMMTRGTKMNNAEDGGSKTCQEIMTQIPLIVNIYRFNYFFGVFKKTSVTRSPDWPGDLEMELIG